MKIEGIFIATFILIGIVGVLSAGWMGLFGVAIVAVFNLVGCWLRDRQQR